MNRKLLALLILALGFAVAALAQSSFSGPLGSLSWIIFGVACILFLTGARGSDVAVFAAGQLRAAPARIPLPSHRRRILGAASIVAAAAALVVFGTDSNQPLAWGLHILSVLLFAAVFVYAPTVKRTPAVLAPVLRSLLTQGLPLLAVLALAAFARWWHLADFPFGTWTDEAVHGLYAMDMLRDSGYRPVYLPETSHPAHFVYLIAGAFRLFGTSTLAMRTVAATISLATVGLAFLLFRRWFGARLALLAAGFLAVMRYDLTFSRFAHHGITTPFFELLVLYCLDRALGSRRLSDFAWLGLSVGFGLAFYLPLRLLPLILAAFLLILSIGFGLREGWQRLFDRYLSALRFHWLAAFLGLLIAVAPVAQYALRYPEQFFSRSSRVSIFTNRSEPDLGKALWNNTREHLQMFNVQGDPNGRHNLPNAPMLDSVMGVLLVLGVAVALWRWRNPANLLMLMLFFGMMLGGILSLDFEAPQSLRSIGVLPSLVYFITLPIAVTVAAAAHVLLPSGRARRGRKGRRAHLIFGGAWAVGLVCLLALVTQLNFVTFFEKQKNDAAVWGSYSTAETIVASELNRHADDYDFIVTALFDQNPTTRFLAGDVKNVRRWTVTDRLPIATESGGRGLILLFDGLLQSAYNDALRLYPQAAVVEHRAPSGGSTQVYQVTISPEQLSELHGVAATYTSPGSTSPILTEARLSALSLDWSAGAPVPAPFEAAFQSTLLAPDFGRYRFELEGDLPATLLIDGFPTGAVELARGLHDLRLIVPGGEGTLELLWQPPGTPELVAVPAGYLFLPSVTNAGLRGEYYASPDWSGEPQLVQLDPQLEYYFHVTPLKRPYSVQWTGALFSPDDGAYTFALYSIDASALSLDGRAVVVNPDGGGTTQGSVELARGWHDIKVRFTDKTGGTRIYLYWTPPGAQQPEVVPARYLRPPMGEYPIAP